MLTVSSENDRIVLSVKREDIRQARIDSEKVSKGAPSLIVQANNHLTRLSQRRRDDLRQGFERLRDALPPSNQRTSKSAILDRGECSSSLLDSNTLFIS